MTPAKCSDVHVPLSWKKDHCPICNGRMWLDRRGDREFVVICRACWSVYSSHDDGHAAELYRAFQRVACREKSQIPVRPWAELLDSVKQLTDAVAETGFTLAHLAFQCANPELMTLVLRKWPEAATV